MHNNDILARNEQEANKFAAWITLITISFILLVYILNVVGIFIAPLGAMTFAFSIAITLMLQFQTYPIQYDVMMKPSIPRL
jgi:small-conductance mechanosensitive channel